MDGPPRAGGGRRGSRVAVTAILLMAALIWLPVARAVAAPAAPPARIASAAQAVDWLSAETAARLDLGFTVLVPSSVPAPFSGEPSVRTSGDSYSLYWMISGGNPMFLEVTGTVGGEIPAFSWYDRNVQLEQNASVQGFAAWQDLTPIYDLVYWQAGDVVYSVNSQGLTDTDTLSLANSLTVLSQPAPATVELPAEQPDESDGGIDETVPAGDQQEPVDPAESGAQADDSTDDSLLAEIGAGAPTSESVDGTVSDSSFGIDAPVRGGDEDRPAPASSDQSQASSDTAVDAGITFGIPKTIQAGQVATVGLHGTADVLLKTDGGTFLQTGGSTYPNAGGFAVEWAAPLVAGNLLVTFSVVDPESGHVVATGQTQVLGAEDAGPVTAALSGPISAVSGSLVYLTVTGHGRLVVDSSTGSWPVQSPNTLFDPDATGDALLVGSLTDGEPASLLWRAPSVQKATTAYVYATDRSGATTATWVITVRPGDLPPAPTPTPGAVPPAPAAAPEMLPSPPASTELPDPGFDFNGVGPKPIDGDGTVDDPPGHPITDPDGTSPTPAAG